MPEDLALKQQTWDTIEKRYVEGEDLRPPNPVLAAKRWKTNAHLIADVAKLGYIHGLVLDATYGLGMWWRKFRPAGLLENDWDHNAAHCLHYDFRAFPDCWGARFDTVAFDPPYVSVGGRETTQMPAFHRRYGMHATPRSPLGLHLGLIQPGLTECVRVLKPRGHLLVKCQDYISSGKFWEGTDKVRDHLVALGLEKVDRFEMVQTHPRPQPWSNRRQIHARRNLSTLLVYQKPR